MKLIITKIKNITDGVKLFRFSPINGESLLAFEAGAHITVKLILENKTCIYRSYSLISNPNNSEYYEIAVLYDKLGRGGSKFMHENLNLKMKLEISPPKNNFLFLKEVPKNIFIAGGIGITPLLSFLRSIDNAYSCVELHYASKRLEDFIFKDEIEEILGKKAYFYTIDPLSHSTLDLNKLMKSITKNTHIYTCGPVSMIKEVKKLSEQLKLNPSHIHFESFLSHSPNLSNNLVLSLAKLKKEIIVQSTESILDAVLASGIKIPYDCKRGECGICAVEFLEGNIDHKDLCLSRNEQKNYMCPCVSHSKSHRIVLNL